MSEDVVIGLIAAVLVLANGLFVAAELALARIRPTQVQELARSGNAAAGSLRHAVDHVDAYLAACQLGITIASIGLGVIGKPAFESLVRPLLGGAAGAAGTAIAATVAFALITLLHVVVGELATKKHRDRGHRAARHTVHARPPGGHAGGGRSTTSSTGEHRWRSCPATQRSRLRWGAGRVSVMGGSS